RRVAPRQSVQLVPELRLSNNWLLCLTVGRRAWPQATALGDDRSRHERVIAAPHLLRELGAGAAEGARADQGRQLSAQHLLRQKSGAALRRPVSVSVRSFPCAVSACRVRARGRVALAEPEADRVQRDPRVASGVRDRASAALLRATA